MHKPMIKMIEMDGAAEKNPDHLNASLFYMVFMVVAGVQILKVKRLCPKSHG